MAGKIPSPTSHTADAIRQKYLAASDQRPRMHLGPSQIGRECERAIWYEFRWVGGEKFDARMLKLLERGKREEAWVVQDLRDIGLTVYEVDEEGKQFGFNEGHWAGSVDAVVEGVIEAPKTPHLLEIKTHGEKSFEWLKKNGLKKGKPEHYAQMQIYMHKLGLTRGLYYAVNKNTDEIYVERVEYSGIDAMAYEAKALRVIISPQPAPRLEQRDGFACTYCKFKKECLEEKLPEMNCRTCVHATPIEGGRWFCESWSKNETNAKIFPAEGVQRHGCERHLFIPGLMPESWIAAGANDKHIIYVDTRTGEKKVNKAGGIIE